MVEAATQRKERGTSYGRRRACCVCNQVYTARSSQQKICPPCKQCMAEKKNVYQTKHMVGGKAISELHQSDVRKKCACCKKMFYSSVYAHRNRFCIDCISEKTNKLYRKNYPKITSKRSIMYMIELGMISTFYYDELMGIGMTEEEISAAKAAHPDYCFPNKGPIVLKKTA